MNFVLAAGGTGGHMIPAHALAAELKARGHGVMLVTDARGSRIPGLFDGVPIHVLPAGRLTKTPWGMLKALRSVMAGRREAKALYRKHRPDAVVGFGGYPAFPALLAASSLKIPTVLHEQNAVLGRVNRLLAGDAAAIATAYENVDRLKPAHEIKTSLVGNPVRSSIVRLGELPFPAFDDYAPLKLLVTGGSQGATVLGEVVPAGLGELSDTLRHRLQVVQQCRPDDIERVRKTYQSLGIPAELSTYLRDMDDKLGECHLMIGRAGASTIAELTAAGRPSILVPLPIATDDHQTANARELAKAGGARMIPQGQFTPAALARQIEALANDPEALANAAGRALSVGRPYAARDLADLVVRVGQGDRPAMIGRASRPAAARPLSPAGAAA
ncbi:UDP-N-acetylglucosamine--N-acetylmuramyl-(pentapeptide) pyrophosphoryl-undecaprenol N-acetylglucosamine transferase [Sphingomonas kaistensis]|uniref:UDP-N-acetylglucosamine--N-acetylmuramyl-(pentapeptide) pyrophosphoryl-undecaprenol N-acetylglucosamine transferase n=1 Tax=Sphingomonas kaistensis TaxID=298708 RepID=A0A7X5Y510_9SPHN|nr:undecaprenyldiphospho-muramoylpentapeptide beta-N-acetylglucosaminyltransferase [Sphingomonas kaistensis]NJC05324.1 UDP-N-acetylglucosamine--N-acetylmuramyl-(pentapeptide) pyrophosphoryl-undecaprenol N-acetylglucosamine transferase [Sphingomonas kaistensis]